MSLISPLFSLILINDFFPLKLDLDDFGAYRSGLPFTLCYTGFEDVILPNPPRPAEFAPVNFIAPWCNS